MGILPRNSSNPANVCKFYSYFDTSSYPDAVLCGRYVDGQYSSVSRQGILRDIKWLVGNEMYCLSSEMTRALSYQYIFSVKLRFARF